ncbi:uncharacterized protein TNCV_3156571 [Trichonephila clavipes]|nr:uncharacterized protein TNCV_3156571 [Trichonephila clavipes]
MFWLFKTTRENLSAIRQAIWAKIFDKMFTEKSEGFYETDHSRQGNKSNIGKANSKNGAWTEALQVVRKVQLRTEKNKLVRLQRCRTLFRLAASQRWEGFLFNGEELFMVQQVPNSCVEAPSPSASIAHHQYPKPVMVCGGICASGKTAFVFCGRGR